MTPPREIQSTAFDESLWQWSAFHPEWKQEVNSHVYEFDDGVVVFDPLLPEAEPERSALLEWLSSVSAGLSIVVLLHYHVRSACEIARETSAPVIAPRADAERIGCVSSPVEPGEAIASGIETYPTGRDDEMIVWLAGPGALIAGDVLLGGKRKPLRVCPQGWLGSRTTRGAVAQQLRPLLELPAKRILLGHGMSIIDDAKEVLRAALDDALPGESTA